MNLDQFKNLCFGILFGCAMFSLHKQSLKTEQLNECITRTHKYSGNCISDKECQAYTVIGEQEEIIDAERNKYQKLIDDCEKRSIWLNCRDYANNHIDGVK